MAHKSSIYIYPALLLALLVLLAGCGNPYYSAMEPVLRLFRDNVLFLKHNLNAQAIGSLQEEFAGLELEIDKLIERMNEAIESSNAFIADMQTS